MLFCERGQLLIPRIATLKGHLSWEAVIQDGGEGEVEEPKVNQRPIERLWFPQSLAVHIYILTLRGGQQIDEPMVTVSLLGTREHEVAASLVHEDQPACDFYCRVSLDVDLPGPGILCLKLWSKTLLGGRTLVGETQIDLEERYLAMMYVRMRQASNEEWISKHVSPAEPIEIEADHVAVCNARLWQSPRPVMKTISDVKQRRASLVVFKPKSRLEASAYDPRLSPPKPNPIETVDLLDPETQGPAGTLRMWVDMGTADQAIPEVSFLPKNHLTFQVRIKVKEVNGISIFKDMGERNDVFLQGKFEWKAVGKELQSCVKYTSTIKFARASASFCEYWVFEVAAPMNSFSMELTLMDDDSFTGPDPIYAAKSICMDPFLQEAYRAYLNHNPTPASLPQAVVFDQYPPGHVHPARGCCGCCKARKRQKPDAATLFLEIEVLAAAEADLHPVTEGRYAEPKGNIDLKSMMYRPGEFIQILLGPKNISKLRICCGCSACTLVALAILAVMYLFIQIFVVPLK